MVVRLYIYKIYARNIVFIMFHIFANKLQPANCWSEWVAGFLAVDLRFCFRRVEPVQSAQDKKRALELMRNRGESLRSKDFQVRIRGAKYR
ncbi:hypothetical protein AX279_03920 [Pseudomonas sp. J237]|nr:hypothetical protein AX279_03920 [Pseudomonas sp. J237]